MNCKPGDLAWVRASKPEYNGALVEVLYAPPSQNFTLPDGAPHIGYAGNEPAWVLRFLSGPVPAPTSTISGRKSWRKAIYGVGRDGALRPIRGNPDESELVTSESESDAI